MGSKKAARTDDDASEAPVSVKTDDSSCSQYENGDSVQELERKYSLANTKGSLAFFPGAQTNRDCYRAIFRDIVQSQDQFPDISRLHNRDVRRSVEAKDFRLRVYFTDRAFKVSDDHWEVRLQKDTGVLMIKHGNGASDAAHTLDRTETKFEMIIPKIGSIDDIARHSVKGRKAPKQLRALFGSKVDEPLYPVVETESLRDKVYYYRPVSYGEREYQIVFELAQDEGEARPLFGRSYDIDQIELEVKRVIDIETGANILKHPEVVGLTAAGVKEFITEPAMDIEEKLLISLYDLKSVYESKPKQGMRIAREAMETELGMKAAEVARQDHFAKTMWQNLSPAQ